MEAFCQLCSLGHSWACGYQDDTWKKGPTQEHQSRDGAGMSNVLKHQSYQEARCSVASCSQCKRQRFSFREWNFVGPWLPGLFNCSWGDSANGSRWLFPVSWGLLMVFFWGGCFFFCKNKKKNPTILKNSRQSFPSPQDFLSITKAIFLKLAKCSFLPQNNSCFKKKKKKSYFLFNSDNSNSFFECHHGKK